MTSRPVCSPRAPDPHTATPTLAIETPLRRQLERPDAVLESFIAESGLAA